MAVCGSNHKNPGSFVLDLGPHDGFGASFFRYTEFAGSSNGSFFQSNLAVNRPGATV